MNKILIFLSIISLINANAVEKRQVDLTNLLLPALFPNLYQTQNQIQNPLMNQIMPFVGPVSNIVQPLINPVLTPVNNQANNIPILGNAIKDCTKNILLCMMVNTDNALNLANKPNGK